MSAGSGRSGECQTCGHQNNEHNFFACRGGNDRAKGRREKGKGKGTEKGKGNGKVIKIQRNKKAETQVSASY